MFSKNCLRCLDKAARGSVVPASSCWKSSIRGWIGTDGECNFSCNSRSSRVVSRVAMTGDKLLRGSFTTDTFVDDSTRVTSSRSPNGPEEFTVCSRDLVCRLTSRLDLPSSANTPSSSLASSLMSRSIIPGAIARGEAAVSMSVFNLGLFNI
eukprot:GFYU01014745.1.p1 GENE.GFYU01014745.1~~GFYU01014745.1.p1  ORF type:complete len:152 (+),score=9.46 GFYU01014745.1:2-457(+)